MNCFVYLSLSVILKISSPQIYHYKKGGEKQTEEEVPNFVAEDKIKKVVIDLQGSHYAVHVTTLVSESGPTVPKVYAFYISDSNKQIKTECTHRIEDEKRLFECNRISRLIIIEGASIQGRYDVNHQDSYLENYVGCFEEVNIEGPPSMEATRDINTCDESCTESPFYAVTGVNFLTGNQDCYCFGDTKGLLYGNLNTCNMTCLGTDFAICGGGYHISIYGRALELIHRGRHLYKPSFDCIYSGKRCPECPSGRRGLSCEVIDCRNNNGNCGPKVCESFTYRRYAIVGVCQCRVGEYLDGNMICQANLHVTPGNESKADDDPLSNPYMLYVAYGLLFMAVIGLCLSINMVCKSLGKSSPMTSSSSSI